MSYNDGFGGSPMEFNYKNSEYNQIEEMQTAAFEEIEQLKIANRELNDVIHQIKTILQILKVQ